MAIEKNEILNLTADLVCAYVGKNRIPTSELSNLIASVHSSLGRLSVDRKHMALQRQVAASKKVGPHLVASSRLQESDKSGSQKHDQLRRGEEHFT